MEDDALLPIPVDEDIITFGLALATFVAWPKHIIDYPGRIHGARFGSSKQFVTPSAKRLTKADAAVLQDKYDSLAEQFQAMEKRMEVGKFVDGPEASTTVKESFTHPRNHIPIPEGIINNCKLFLDTPYTRAVAIGTMYNTHDAMIHCTNPSNHLKVSIYISMEDDALLPIPVDEDIITVGLALATFVAWPKHIIDYPGRIHGARFGSSKQFVTPSAKRLTKADATVLQDKYDSLTEQFQAMEKRMEVGKFFDGPEASTTVKECFTHPRNHIPIPEGIINNCKLFLDTPYTRAVEIGTVYNTHDAMIHCTNPSNHLKVSIYISMEDDALLPIPVDEDIITVGLALATFVAWPKHIIDYPGRIHGARFGSSKQFVTPSAKRLTKADATVLQDKYDSLTEQFQAMEKRMEVGKFFDGPEASTTVKECFTHPRNHIPIHIDDALLPIPVDEDIITFGLALATFVAWPKHIIDYPGRIHGARFGSSKQFVTPSAKRLTKADAAVLQDKYDSLAEQFQAMEKRMEVGKFVDGPEASTTVKESFTHPRNHIPIPEGIINNCKLFLDTPYTRAVAIGTMYNTHDAMIHCTNPLKSFEGLN
ncbi:hypothetical protein Lal_00004448 [Lupinus albus]|nr:hypothetical protein Lal_00004448 [Lupinus albus]